MANKKQTSPKVANKAFKKIPPTHAPLCSFNRSSCWNGKKIERKLCLRNF